MGKKECIAMLLAGGQGSRLGPLTSKIAKPAVSFGGKFRIIDFSLSNCANSGIDTVGVLTQYRPYLLHSYVGSGSAWDLDERGGGVSILPPYATQQGGMWYAGTADSVQQNIEFIKLHDPDYVLILSGDHLYRMDYRDMLKTHIENDADLTVSVIPVPWEDASRFGLVTKNEEGRVVKFSEKPAHPDSNLASMGIYIFTTEVLIKALEEDARDEDSAHDFGKNIIPGLLAQGNRIFCHEFRGFWKDVGTIASYYDTSMSLLGDDPEFDLYSEDFPVMSGGPARPPHYIGGDARLDDSLVANGCKVFGRVRHSILSTDCEVGEGALVEDAVLLPGAQVRAGAQVRHAILGEGAVVSEGASFGSSEPGAEIAVVGDDAVVGKEA